MNNLELHALFQAEEEVLRRAFQRHDLMGRDYTQERMLAFPSLLQDVFKFPDDILCQKLKTQIDAGVKIDATLSGHRTAFQICFQDGKMASMRLLLAMGAKTTWTSDQISLAFGKVPTEPQIGEADPFHFACRVGNLDAAKEYLPQYHSGLNKSSGAVIAAVKVRATDVVTWLMDLGFDPNALDEFKFEALERAVDNDDVPTAEVLLAAGAAPFGSPEKTYTSAVKKTVSNEMRILFVRYGVNPAHFDYRVPSLEYPNVARLPEVTLTKSAFDEHRTNRAGRSNPEPFLPPFWSQQMRCSSRYAELKSLGYTPDRNRPIWSFARYGRTATMLPDDRLVLIAGEYEDSYHADFCIYADITVLGCNGEVDHFIYPEDVFPPTDFHSATLLGNHIWLIGSLGYLEQREENKTQVLRLNIEDFSISTIPTTGEAPGWISRHRAALSHAGIVVTGGKIHPDYRDNEASFLLNTESFCWSKMPDNSHS
jgi:hypothetical protein